jgi:hypothetical protein
MTRSDSTNNQDTNSTTRFFDNFYEQEISFNASEVDAVIGYFLKRGFDKVAATNTASIILQQASSDGISAFQLIDTLKGATDVQLSNVIAQILNTNRSKTSAVGYKVAPQRQLFDQRQIIV